MVAETDNLDKPNQTPITAHPLDGELLLAFDRARVEPTRRFFYDMPDKVAVNIFLIVSLLTILAWLTPDWVIGKPMVTRFTWPIMAGSGLIQHWSLFSPSVRNINYHCVANIEFSDGTVRCYEFPRTEKMRGFEKFRAEKKRKMFGDCMPWANYAQFLPNIARYLARANYDYANPTVKPVRVSILKYSAITPPPDSKHWTYRDKLPYHTDAITIFAYQVKPQDLQKDDP